MSAHDQEALDLNSIFAAAVSAHQSGDYKSAQELYSKVINIDPCHTASCHNLGLIYHDLGDSVAAVKLLSQAVEKEGNPQYFCNFGRILLDINRLKEAEEVLSKSLQMNPAQADSYVNLAALYNKQGKFTKAQKSAKNAIEIESNNIEAYFNLSSSLKSQKKIKQAIQGLEKAYEINPDHPSVQVLLLELYQNSCNWDGLRNIKDKVQCTTKEIIEQGGVPALTPFIDITINDNPEDNLMVAKAWARQVQQRVSHYKSNFIHDRKRKHNDKVTLGYLSSDFRDHTVSYIIQDVFSAHDRDNFVVNAYSTSKDDGSEIRQKIVNDCDKFIDLHDLNDFQAAEKIHDDKVDVLIDLVGHTWGERLGIAALKPAPVNISLWGFVGTTGLEEMDYIIADKTVLPPDQRQYYTEEVVYFPGGVQVNHSNETFSEKFKTRSDCGLPEDKFIFCSLNQAYKIEPIIFDVWMQLLKQVPDSVLWLSNHDKITEENLKKEAIDRGIGEDQLIFTQKLDSRDEYFKRLSFADLALDTRIYNGGSTTMDALWAGVPVITLLGNNYASRMSASLISGVGMDELITNTIDEYQGLAMGAATNPFKINEIRGRLNANKASSSLFNTKDYIKKLEVLLQEIWQNKIRN